jgi:hypothetical protein
MNKKIQQGRFVKAKRGHPLKGLSRERPPPYSTFYFVEIMGFCVMGNHFHLLVKMIPECDYTDEDIQKRYEAFYGDESVFAPGWIPSLRAMLSSISEFVREIKVNFARYYNKRHNHRGYFWGDRFKNVFIFKREKIP